MKRNTWHILSFERSLSNFEFWQINMKFSLLVLKVFIFYMCFCLVLFYFPLNEKNKDMNTKEEQEKIATKFLTKKERAKEEMNK